MRIRDLSTNVSRRGAGRVGIIWLIVVGILAAIGAAYGLLGQDEASKVQKAYDQAVSDRGQAQDDLLVKTNELAERSRVLGFTTDAATIPSNVDAANSSLAELKDAFPDMEPVGTFQEAVPSVIKAYQARVGEIATLQTRINDLQGQVTAERDAKSSLETDKDEQIASLQQQLSDEQENSRSEISRLEDANSDLSGRYSSSTDRITELQDDLRKRDRTIEEKDRNAASTKLQYTKRLNDIEKRSEKADGEISAVATEFGVGYINLGTDDRLSEGTVFRIVSGKPGTDINTPKAFARVVDVRPDFSEVEIYEVADRFQPVVTGDKIYNPLYEPKGQRNAVLAGAISGAYNEPELRLLFAEIGINIQNEVSNTTDFLITGGPLFTDADGEPLDEPLQVDQLPVYGAARDQGVTIVPIRDVLQYFER
ncbi:MAG: hypothetical protein AAF957_16255 [Planctomycetota bacterium]